MELTRSISLRPRSVRAAFSIVELLITIAIVAVLVSLLLPGIQASRESARRMHCGNNLKQIALASLAFHDQRCWLPPSRIAKQHPSWLYLILPHLEQSAVQWNGATNNSMYEMPRELRTFVVSQYLCPSRARESAVVTLQADRVSFFPDRRDFDGSVSDYGGCKGARVLGESYTGAGVLLENGVIVHGISDQFPTNARHITGWRGRISLSSIEDGSSRTLLAGEISALSAQSRHAFNGDKTGGEWLGTLDPPAASGEDQGFGSDHHEIIHFALCDGSVRPLSVGIPRAVCEALATKSGGEAFE